jgi:UPF0176 protein
MLSMPEFINISAYKFVELDRLPQRKAMLLPLCKSLELKGTILLSTEGINLFVAGTRASIEHFLRELQSCPEFENLPIKESISDHQPFSRMLVRLKKEIISMGVEAIRPEHKTSPKISARELKQWLDEGREVALLDTRNDYEVELGTFENAIPIGVDHFRRFPDAVDRLPEELRDKPLVMFCTGGIRCEKAGPLMEQKGFRNVFQLDGGILKYFEECGGDHYQGDCFVFDKRVAVDPLLNETEAEQCYACQAILSVSDQQAETYDPPHSCPHCFRTPAQKMQDALRQRESILQSKIDPLPGSVPYVNRRPMTVSLKHDGLPLIEFLESVNARLDREFWSREIGLQHVVCKDAPLTLDTNVRAGWRVEHLVPHTTEPDVASNIEFLYEDDGLIAVNKPAPLPMHPCGRFNRNTLQHFLRLTYEGEQVRILHRLDASTTGVVLLARKRVVAASIQAQFAAGEIDKVYLARVHGRPPAESFSCDSPIGSEPSEVGGLRKVDPDGRPALTKFEIVHSFPDGTSLVKCFPKTGRTNQIRIHLSHLGLPIVGDEGYGKWVAGNAANALATESATQGLHLHASEIGFVHVTGQRKTISAPIPSWAKQ